MPLDIHCPRCEWQPHPTDLWGCTCGHAWHTFATGGTCPRCRHRWHDTQCLSCAQWSPHLDWYHDTQGLVEELVEEALSVPALPRP